MIYTIGKMLKLLKNDDFYWEYISYCSHQYVLFKIFWKLLLMDNIIVFDSFFKIIVVCKNISSLHQHVCLQTLCLHKSTTKITYNLNLLSTNFILVAWICNNRSPRSRHHLHSKTLLARINRISCFLTMVVFRCLVFVCFMFKWDSFNRIGILWILNLWFYYINLLTGNTIIIPPFFPTGFYPWKQTTEKKKEFRYSLFFGEFLFIKN